MSQRIFFSIKLSTKVSINVQLQDEIVWLAQKKTERPFRYIQNLRLLDFWR